MAVVEVNHLTIERGTDFEATFNLPQDFPLRTLSGSTVVARIRKYPTSPKQITFDWYINEEENKIRISLTDDTTMFLSSGRNVFDVLVAKDNKTYKFVKGTIIVNETSTVGAGLDNDAEGGFVVPQNLSELNDVDVNALNKKDKYVFVYDSATNKYTLVNPDALLSAAAEDETTQPGLPSDFIDRLDVDLDNKIDVDAGQF